MARPKYQGRVLHRLVYELRYDEGFVYLDRCGHTLNRLLREFPGWQVGDIGTVSGQIAQPERNKVFTFSPLKLDLGQTQDAQVTVLDPSSDFAAEAEKLTGVVVDELGLTSYSRIGVRAWNLFGVESTDDAHRLVLGMGVLDAGAVAGAVQGDPSDGAFSVVVERKGADWRVAVTTVEQNVSRDPQALRRMAKSRPHRLESGERKQALYDKIRAEKALKHYPPIAVLVDIDACVEDPPVPDNLKIADFISEQIAAMNAAAEGIMALGG